MKRWHITLAAVALFAALLVYVLMFESDREPPAGPDAVPSPTPIPLLSLELGELRAIDILAGEQVLRLVQESGAWQIAAPRPGKADAAVYWPIEELARLQARIPLPGGETELETYHLDPPALILSVETADGVRARILVGRKTPDGTAYYVQRQGEPGLYLVDAYVIDPFHGWLDDPPYE